MNPLKRFLLIASIAALTVPVANATTLTIDDLSESPTFTNTDFPGSTLPFVDGPNAPIDVLVAGVFPSVDVRFIFLEPGSTTNVSDIVHLTVALHGLGAILTDVIIEFQSDGGTPLAMPAPLPIDEILTEFGTFQTLYSATFGTESLIFQFASDVERTVPEPGTLALLGIGLAGIGFARRHKLR